MHRAHKVALTALCVSVLGILLGFAHILALILRAHHLANYLAVLFTLEYATILYLIWRY